MDLTRFFTLFNGPERELREGLTMAFITMNPFVVIETVNELKRSLSPKDRMYLDGVIASLAEESSEKKTAELDAAKIVLTEMKTMRECIRRMNNAYDMADMNSLQPVSMNDCLKYSLDEWVYYYDTAIQDWEKKIEEIS